MRINILIAGTALAMSATPAFAGGSAAGGGIRPLRGLLAGGNNNPVQRAGSSVSQCLCETAGTALKSIRGGSLITMPKAGTAGIARMPRTGGGARLLVNSVVGLNGVRGVQGGNHRGIGAAIGLAGTLDGAVSVGHAYGKGHLGLGLAGSVTNSGIGLAGPGGHGRPLVNVSVANAEGGKAGTLANVSVLNGKGTHGHSAVNVAALHGSGGTSGHVANVSVLNRSSTHGHSAANVAALNGSGRSRGRVAKVSVLNRSGTHGHSAVNVAALNGSRGSSGHVANVSVLNRSGTHGHSAVNVAALNVSGGSSGRIVNVSVLNGKSTSGHSLLNVAALNGLTHKGGGGGNGGLLGGIRIINGVPCLPDGTPLTGEAAKAALMAMSPSRQSASSSSTGFRSNSSAPTTHPRTGTFMGSPFRPTSHQAPRANFAAPGGPSGQDRRLPPNKD
jgi:hypothetical protein